MKLLIVVLALALCPLFVNAGAHGTFGVELEFGNSVYVYKADGTDAETNYKVELPKTDFGAAGSWRITLDNFIKKKAPGIDAPAHVLAAARKALGKAKPADGSKVLYDCKVEIAPKTPSTVENTKTFVTQLKALYDDMKTGEGEKVYCYKTKVPIEWDEAKKPGDYPHDQQLYYRMKYSQVDGVACVDLTGGAQPSKAEAQITVDIQLSKLHELKGLLYAETFKGILKTRPDILKEIQALAIGDAKAETVITNGLVILAEIAALQPDDGGVMMKQSWGVNPKVEPCTAAAHLVALSKTKLTRAKIAEILEKAVPSAKSARRANLYKKIGGSDAVCREFQPADTTVFKPTAADDPTWVCELRTPPKNSMCLKITHWDTLSNGAASDDDIAACVAELKGEAPKVPEPTHTKEACPAECHACKCIRQLSGTFIKKDSCDKNACNAKLPKGAKCENEVLVCEPKKGGFLETASNVLAPLSLPSN